MPVKIAIQLAEDIAMALLLLPREHDRAQDRHQDQD
jgi:hypothetical protein